ncbi:MAG: alpha/beta hydrolase [Gordonia sp. (in: high G+C Gram-positive bacteria)]|uniref:alpha/beta fold hydrolase n=1 Tax=Gordonia sp. (in: high G+C Gram-positive bacteria) TaxID=84139 RepID=UPI003BB7C9DA
MTAFSVAGADLAWELSDEGGVPVVQLHGLTSSRARDRVLDLDLGIGLSGTRLLRYDARGHGESTGRAVPGDYRWPHLADDLLALLDAQFPGEQVYGVGTSMGCGTLLHAATRAPDRFTGLTLLLPPTAWETRKAQRQHYRTTADLIEAQGLSAFLERAAEEPAPPATVGRPATLPEVRADLLPSLFRGAGESDLPDPAEMARVEVPVRILAWVDDPAHPMSTAHALAAMLPNATLTVASCPNDVRAWPAVLHADVIDLPQRGR